jgi:hypothetical protein
MRYTLSGNVLPSAGPLAGSDESNIQHFLGWAGILAGQSCGATQVTVHAVRDVSGRAAVVPHLVRRHGARSGHGQPEVSQELAGERRCGQGGAQKAARGPRLPRLACGRHVWSSDDAADETAPRGPSCTGAGHCAQRAPTRERQRSHGSAGGWMCQGSCYLSMACMGSVCLRWCVALRSGQLHQYNAPQRLPFAQGPSRPHCAAH